MNKPSYCYFCRRITLTKEWDCVICKFSKPIPKSEGEEGPTDYGRVEIISEEGVQPYFEIYEVFGDPSGDGGHFLWEPDAKTALQCFDDSKYEIRKIRVFV